MTRGILTSFACFLAILLSSSGCYLQTNVSLIYTGKSLGVLGNTRFQQEHDLLAQRAIEDSLDLKLVSHLCWRAKGITIFLPSDEPEADELARILARQGEWEYRGRFPALRTDHVLIFQDPDELEIDMIQILLEHKSTARNFPDLQHSSVQLFETEILGDMDAMIVVEDGAEWPVHIDHWTEGEINRVDFGKDSRIFELPYNFGTFGVRAAIFDSIDAGQPTLTIKADLGHRNGEFDLPTPERARLDFRGLSQLGYEFLVPYEFELGLGANLLYDVRHRFPDIRMLATNVSTGTDLLEPFALKEMGPVRVGLLGLVDPLLEVNLPGFVLEDFTFKPLHKAVEEAIDSLREAGADLIIALSNMSPSQNAALAEQVAGIHLIV
ncbi:MAG: hypothetical protein R3350_06575, partial [Saprospiraceae bacterium]|nr:hypothetical protein [Saprospiraceae bacterium]